MGLFNKLFRKTEEHHITNNAEMSNEEKCNRCGLCAAACHESTIGMINEKNNLHVMIVVTVLATVCLPARQPHSF